MKTSKRTPFKLITSFIAFVTCTIWAAKAPLSDDKREKEAYHIVTGKVESLTSGFKKSPTEIGRDLGMHSYLFKVVVDSVVKGDEIKAGATIEIKAWRRSTRIPSLQGQDWVPAKGDRVTFYLTGGKGKPYEPILPNGIELEKAAAEKKPSGGPKSEGDGKIRILDGEKAEKIEIRHSMIGFRNTLLFYTFKDQQAVLVLSIGNKDDTFPVTGKIHLFDEAATGESLKKWINNQHSDGLFADAPTPVFTEDLPKGVCKVTSQKQTGMSKSPTGPIMFKNYEVKFSVKPHTIGKKCKLSEFTGTAQVHVEGN
jgi:hypothetical protein